MHTIIEILRNLALLVALVAAVPSLVVLIIIAPFSDLVRLAVVYNDKDSDDDVKDETNEEDSEDEISEDEDSEDDEDGEIPPPPPTEDSEDEDEYHPPPCLEIPEGFIAEVLAHAHYGLRLCEAPPPITSDHTASSASADDETRPSSEIPPSS